MGMQWRGARGLQEKGENNKEESVAAEEKQ
jgi:hypothetical protein